MKSLMSVRQFSEITGIGYKRSRQLVLSGAIPSKEVGCRKLISARWLDRWLEEGTAVTVDSKNAKLITEIPWNRARSVASSPRYPVLPREIKPPLLDAYGNARLGKARYSIP